MKKYLTGDDFNNKTLFFLDAHVDICCNIHNYKKKCPLFEEKTAFPWDESSYGNIDFLQQILRKIHSINENYKFATQHGHIEDDVLIAYL